MIDNWIKEYHRKLTTPQKAVRELSDGATIVHGMSAAEPPALLEAIAERVREGSLKDIKIYSLLPMEHAARTVLAPDLAHKVKAYSWFVSASDRGLVSSGLSHFVPNHFREIPRFIREFMQVDVTVTCVSAMDRAGYFSLGTSNDFTSTAARHCKRLIVEVNQNMPRVFGDSLVHISEVDAVVENFVPLIEVPTSPPKPEDDMIGKRVAGLIPDGAALQLGLGSLPNSVARCLGDHKDLGIHTENFVHGMVDLIEKGAITGRRKTLHPRKHVFTVAMGVKRLYDFLHDNPAVESYPVSYTNDPTIIAQNDNMVSVNSVLQVDLLGQCNAEFLAGSQFSGTGGQLDFVRGAFNSRGGKAILVFRSTAKNGEVSSVVPTFDTSCVVTTPRMDTHYLVSEYGAADLKGKSTRERALAIIELAHPRFREGLLKGAREMHLL